MPIKLFCSNCNEEIKKGEDFVDVMISIKEWDGLNDNLDAKDQEYADFCENCVEKHNISAKLLIKLNKRNPNPDRKGK